MPTILSVVSFSGGQGKTTSLLILARLLAQEGKRVLVVDADPQGASTLGLGVEVNALTPSTLEVIRGEVAAAEAVVPVAENLFCIPADGGLSAAAGYMRDSGAGAGLLRTRLRKVKDFDFLLIDSPGHSDALAQAAISAADKILVACTVDSKGAGAVITTIQGIEDMEAHGLVEGELIGVIPCRDKWYGNYRGKAEQAGVDVLTEAAKELGFKLWPWVAESAEIRQAHDRQELPCKEDLLFPYKLIIEEDLCPP